jgi:hypothetical protein
MITIVTFMTCFLVALRPATGDPELPTAIRHILATQHPGWTFAQLDSFNTAGLHPGDRADWVSGDFDADGRLDYAVQVVDTRLQVDSQQVVIGFLARAGSFEPYPIQSGYRTNQDYLRVNATGANGFDIESRSAFRYDRDTLSILLDQTAAFDCPFINGRFRCRVSGD